MDSLNLLVISKTEGRLYIHIPVFLSVTQNLQYDVYETILSILAKIGGPFMCVRDFHDKSFTHNGMLTALKGSQFYFNLLLLQLVLCGPKSLPVHHP